MTKLIKSKNHLRLYSFSSWSVFWLEPSKFSNQLIIIKTKTEVLYFLNSSGQNEHFGRKYFAEKHFAEKNLVETFFVENMTNCQILKLYFFPHRFSDKKARVSVHEICKQDRSLYSLVRMLQLWMTTMLMQWLAKWTETLETCGLYYKCLTIVIYDHYDIGLYYKTRDDRNWRSS